jgi:hypothetical protein
MNRSFSEDRPYCLERFVRDIDPQEKMRLGMLKDVALVRYQEIRDNGVGRHSNAIGAGQEKLQKSAEGHNQTQTLGMREKKPGNVGAA